jgi:hypothetical protein
VPVISQRTREHVAHVYGIQHSACFIRDEDFQRDDILSRKNTLREHFAGRQYGLSARGLKVGKPSTFRIGFKFVNVKEISRQNAPEGLFSSSIHFVAIGCFVDAQKV